MNKATYPIKPSNRTRKQPVRTGYAPAAGKAGRAHPVRIVLLLLLAVVLFISWMIYRQQQQQYANLQQQNSELAQKLTELDASNQELKQQLANLDSPEYIEEYAREHLNMVKPGDIIFESSDQEQTSAETETATDSQSP
ncbi:MAG: septum formation initiator family protein [Oscillospiraceae bacterium]|nr:septum formation initiator family protein [Oscillospiraceae bacterium]MDD4367848.1 septum formation initiator family protein [Oscillospiraceae bacterium]